ncbi:hypothetical protein C900_03591 [Fulvivirga imtechensis AK7]|uniref:Glycosyltransferase n=2 Tax=Fulvivirga TaxID=396811 RepID=L8JP42_9BACT|nr:hypothetical protein C900_03591 [Fulvivirga imtechensis AK7]
MLLAELLPLHDRDRFEFNYVYFLPWKDQMVPALLENRANVHCFKASNNIKILTQYRHVISYVKEHGIDVIHAHLPWAGFLARIVHFKTGVPVLYTEHNKQERYHKITYWLNKLSFNYQSAVIAVSEDVASSIYDNLKPSIPVEVIVNGVNTNKFQRNEQRGLSVRKKYNIPEDATVVGTIAVFRFQKRLKEWLQVFSKAAEVNHSLYGVIVGDGPLKNELIEERKRLKLEDKIVMPGLQTNTVDWFSAMDIYMMTSVFEGLPIALLEAMSCQCAILSTNAGGVKEVIHSGNEGLLVNVSDWSLMPELLEQLTADQKAVEKMGENARMRVVESFSLENMVERIEARYLKAVNEK